MYLAQILRQHFPSFDFSFDYPLGQKSYFKVGGKAEVFYSAKNRQEAMDLLLFCQRENIKFYVVGDLSNVVIADEGLKGLVLHLGFDELRLISAHNEELVYQADSGLKTSTLVGKVALLGASGLEGFIGVPGTIGAAIYNNAHYLDNLIGNYVKQVEVFDVKKAAIVQFTREKCEFAYEQSIFQKEPNLLIFSAYFTLKKLPLDQIKQKMQLAIKQRELTQPLNLPSSGCIFRNPKNNEHLKNLFPQFSQAKFIPAGFLIEQAGLKGVSEGDIQVSEKHAAFLLNLGHGKSADVQKLIAKVKDVILNKFGVILEEEVFYLK
ncbi:MAG TPA: UDP-N-acetylmuramate dehydrogenase [Candidatus Woesebacteria bacterium]|nr:UDP-N-acetylmuramate dehydrogenase [Candidatus Woesebacteria bacterium]